MKENSLIAWRQVGMCFVLIAMGTMATSTYGVIALPLAREFQTSRMVLMLAMTAMAAATAVMSPFAGALMDRISLRKLMLLGGVLLALTHFALSYVTSFAQVLLIYAFLMAPAALLLGPIATSVLLSRWFVEHRGRALAIAIAGISAGAMVFPPLIQGLLDNHDWRDAFRILALVLLCLTVPAALLIVSHPPRSAAQLEGLSAENAPAEVPAVLALRSILTDRAFWLVVLMIGVMSSGIKGMITNLVPLAIDQGIAPDVAAKLISGYAALGVLATLTFAGLADRVQPRTIMFAMVTAFGLGMACLTQAHHGFWPIAVGVSLLGLAGATMVALQGLLVAWIFGAYAVGRVMGVMSSVLLTTSLLMPPMFGLIFDVTGSYAPMFVILVALSIISLLSIPYVRLRARDEAKARHAVAA